MCQLEDGVWRLWSRPEEDSWSQTKTRASCPNKLFIESPTLVDSKKFMGLARFSLA